jgi:hypothetical protein
MAPDVSIQISPSGRKARSQLKKTFGPKSVAAQGIFPAWRDRGRDAHINCAPLDSFSKGVIAAVVYGRG